MANLFMLISLHGVFVYQCNTEVIACLDGNGCNGRPLTCMEGEDCVIECNGKSVCSFSDIICPEYATCSLICDGDLSCSHITITAQRSFLLNVISHYGYEPLSFARIFCPHNTDIGPCAISYFGNQSALSSMDIYSIYGYNRDHVDIECGSITTCWRDDYNPSMHFGSNYSNTCDVYGINDMNESSCASDIIYTTEIALGAYKKDPYNLPLLLVLVLVVISVVSCCFLPLWAFCCCFSNKRISDEAVTIKVKTHADAPVTPRFKSSNWSPDLQARISPEADLQLDLNIIEEAAAEHEHTVNVTVQKYSNINNRNDESAINSPLSRADSIQDVHVVTDGVADDEFIVSPLSKQYL